MTWDLGVVGSTPCAGVGYGNSLACDFMRLGADEPCPLPDDPVLAEWATAMSDMGDWGWIVDVSWKLRFMTDEQRLSLAADVEMIPLLIGEYLFGPEMTRMSSTWLTGSAQRQPLRGLFANVGGLVLADTADGKAELRSVLDPSLTEMVDELSPSHANVTTGSMSAAGTSERDGSCSRRRTVSATRRASCGALRSSSSRRWA